MSLVTPQEIVTNNANRYQAVIQENTLVGLLQLVRDLLFYRIPSHAGTNNSRVVEKIQRFGVIIEQLTVHVAQKDILSFLSALNGCLEEGWKIKECIVKRPGENDVAIKQYRNMVYEIWNRVCKKVEGMIRSIIEQNKEKNAAQLFGSLLGHLAEQQMEAVEALADLDIPEATLSMFN